MIRELFWHLTWFFHQELQPSFDLAIPLPWV